MSMTTTAVAPGMPPLTRNQTEALDTTIALLGVAEILYVTGPIGSGKTTILRHLAHRTGARLLTATDGMRAVNQCAPAHMEEALIDFVRNAFADSDVVLFDDWWSMASFALVAPDRPHFLLQTIAALFRSLAWTGKTFVATARAGDPALLTGATGSWVTLRALDLVEQRHILEYHSGIVIPDGALEELQRHYRALDGYQLTAMGSVLQGRHCERPTGTELVDLLSVMTQSTNVSLDEVENVGARRLVGSEAHIETLERTVLIPMVETALAKQLGLRPARGVLLHGRPGTGKTTLGRLLAHRMQGRFFVIDGTMLADRTEFSENVNRLLVRAAARSPSVVFIDDADVIFRNGQARGFVRQLLTKLDGLASESQRHVCLVMTAMDVADLPPALLRSGRVDVWIEMKLPDTVQRAQIICDYAALAQTDCGAFDAEAIARRCDGFTPADLRGMVADAKGATAYEMLCEEPARPFDVHLEEAAAEIDARKQLVGV